MGVSPGYIQAVFLQLDELEDLRLCDLLNLDQEEAGREMGVSRATVQRLLSSTRAKVAEALIYGKALVIVHGPRVQFQPGHHRYGQAVLSCKMSIMREKITHWILELLRFPTVTGREKLCAGYLAEELEKLGMSVFEQPVFGANANILATRGEGGPWIVTHLDVYPPFEHPDPFQPRIEKDHIVGRGAVDTKGQIAALLCTLSQTEEPVQVALVVDEEELGRGSEALEVPAKVEAAVVLEPTNLQIAVAEAGSVGLEVLVRGKPAHGSTPWAGDSAIERAFHLYERLLSAPFMAHRHPLFPKGAWVNLGRIEGGYDTMVVPSHCRMELDLGFAPGLSAQEVIAQTTEALAEAERIFVTDAWEPWETSKDEKVVIALSAACERILGRKSSFTGMPSWTDAANIVRKGVPAVVFGAGDLAVAHTWHESVSLGDLVILAQVLAAFIRHRPRE